MRWFAVLLAAQVLACAESLPEQIEGLLNATPEARGAFWGIQIVRAGDGSVLYAKNEDRFFVPASNTKLFTTALAIERLGPEYRFRTTVGATAVPAGGVIPGDLVLTGGGDPTLSAREYPYRKGPIMGNPLGPIEELAGRIEALGISRINGNVIGDDTAFVWQPYPEGWAQDDAIWEYGAPVSALAINDSSIKVELKPGRSVSLPARLTVSPVVEYFVIDNRVVTTARGNGKVEIDRAPGSRQLRLWGSIPLNSQGRTILLAVDDPALYAATVFRDALVRRGITVTGEVVARHRYQSEVRDLKNGNGQMANSPAAHELIRRDSPPLAEILQVIDKVSQNLHAEISLREVARVRRNIGSREAGLEEMRAFLAGAGIGENEYGFEDGSGLSRLNLVTPAAVAKLLRYMHGSSNARAWRELLPVGGEDGTLRDRFQGEAAAQRVFAKTGTLSHVSALSGYVESRTNGVLAFSILVNNYRAPARDVRTVIDRICSLIAQ
ncbi:MAG: D-alanyl-D-alanine carboxypeptidase/D-alanyl-D-alanine-endopeptidase [Bryobacteraceae bacterium]